MINQIKQKIIYWALSFLEIQLLITIFCIPIFINWGIALSYMSFIGNLIFSPILTIFLVISTFIQITEVFKIPNSILKNCLEIFTQYWIKLINYGKKTWMIGFKEFLFWPAIIALFLGFLTIYIIKKPKIKVLILATILISIITLNFLIPINSSFKVAKNKNCYTLVNIKNNNIEVIDNGALSNYSNNYIRYKLVPEINKKSGLNKINLLKVRKLSFSTYKSLRTLNDLCLIKRIKIEYPEKGDYKKAYALIKSRH